ncbi:MAG: hypothetical protein R6T93_09330 [Trueperaceae bacterium]
MSPALEAWVFFCSLLFLAGIVLVVSAAVPSARERYPKALIHGFLLAIASFALVIVGAVVLG